MFKLEFLLLIIISLLNFVFANNAGLCEDTGTIVPLYLYPETTNGIHNWQPLIDAYNNYSIPVWAIVNVNSGPGSDLDSNYKTSVDMLKASGINTLGYIRTNYTERSIVIVKEEIDSWKALYTPHGIFFDEMAYTNDQSMANYYTEISNYAKQQGYTFTVGNPGVDVPEMYVNTVDTIMISESSGNFPTFDQYCGWHSNYPKTNWGIFPYNLPSLDFFTNREKILAAKNCIGFIYITDDQGVNPWDTLPPYLHRLFSLLVL